MNSKIIFKYSKFISLLLVFCFTFIFTEKQSVIAADDAECTSPTKNKILIYENPNFTENCKAYNNQITISNPKNTSSIKFIETDLAIKVVEGDYRITFFNDVNDISKYFLYNDKYEYKSIKKAKSLKIEIIKKNDSKNWKDTNGFKKEGVYLFLEGDYIGPVTFFSKEDISKYDQNQINLNTKESSSVKIIGNYQVTLTTADGKTKDISSDTPTLDNDFNDKATSIKIKKTSNNQNQNNSSGNNSSGTTSANTNSGGENTGTGTGTGTETPSSSESETDNEGENTETEDGSNQSLRGDSVENINIPYTGGRNNLQRFIPQDFRNPTFRDEGKLRLPGMSLKVMSPENEKFIRNAERAIKIIEYLKNSVGIDEIIKQKNDFFEMKLYDEENPEDQIYIAKSSPQFGSSAGEGNPVIKDILTDYNYVSPVITPEEMTEADLNNALYDLKEHLPEGTVENFVFGVIRFNLIIIEVMAIFFLMYGGYLWTVSQGEEGELEKGKKIILWSVIAMIGSAICYVIVSIITQMFTN